MSTAPHSLLGQLHGDDSSGGCYSGVFVPVRQDHYELDLDAIRAAITPRTKAISSSAPPTIPPVRCTARRACGSWPIWRSSTISLSWLMRSMKKMVYDGAKHFSVASISRRRCGSGPLRSMVFPKAYAMTGWRIGYAAARADVIKGNHGGAEPDYLCHQRDFPRRRL